MTAPRHTPEGVLGSHPGTGAKPGRGIAPTGARGVFGLTPMQVRLLRFIAGYLEAHDGVSPRMIDMAQAIGTRSKSAPHRYLEALEDRGWLRRSRGRHRAIEVLKPIAIPRATDGVPLYFIPAGQLPGGAKTVSFHTADIGRGEPKNHG